MTAKNFNLCILKVWGCIYYSNVRINYWSKEYKIKSQKKQQFIEEKEHKIQENGKLHIIILILRIITILHQRKKKKRKAIPDKTVKCNFQLLLGTFPSYNCNYS